MSGIALTVEQLAAVLPDLFPQQDEPRRGDDDLRETTLQIAFLGG
jgi:hypothetical protein